MGYDLRMLRLHGRRRRAARLSASVATVRCRPSHQWSRNRRIERCSTHGSLPLSSTHITQY